MNALLFKLEQFLGADGLNFRYNDIGLVLFHHSLERIAIKHREHLALVGHLHGRGVIVAVASNYILAGTHGGNNKLLAQFA